MDHRNLAAAAGKWYKELDEKKMLAIVSIEDDEEVEIPIQFEVCGTCDGKGHHVNPSIDSNGITMSEWQDWTDEEQEYYRSGGYDVTCYECGGKRVVPVPNKELMSQEQCEAMEYVQEDICERISDYRTYRMENGEYD